MSDDRISIFARLLLLAVAGSAGTLARYGLAGIAQRITGDAFPWGTFFVNILGSFLFGAIWTASTERNLLSPDARFYILTGFMGAFTTFSTLMYESGRYLQQGQPLMYLANAGGQLLVGTIGLFLGFAAGRVL